jgi:hypothetical protein
VAGPNGRMHVVLRTPIQDSEHTQLDLNHATMLTFVPPTSGLPSLQRALGDRTLGRLEFQEVVPMPGGGNKFTVRAEAGGGLALPAGWPAGRQGPPLWAPLEGAHGVAQPTLDPPNRA